MKNMNKKVLYFIGIFFIVALLIIVFTIRHNNNSKELEFRYKTNGGVPYKWQYEIKDKSIVKIVKEYEVENKNGLVGAPIIIGYVFKGLKEGTTTITFKYVSITDNSVSKEEKHVVVVDKNKNISLKD